MKMIISFLFVIFSSCVNASVVIYKSDMSLLTIESIDGDDSFSSTLYGGSQDIGQSSPAACAIKYKLEKGPNGFYGELKSFFTENMGYSIKEKDESLLEYSKSGISVVTSEPLSVCPIMTRFSGEYVLVDKGSDGFKSEFNTLLQLNFYDAGKSFRGGHINDAIKTLKPYMSEAIAMNIYNMEAYNDYGYFLQKAGVDSKAVEYFDVVIHKSPKRIVVYLNMADSLWALNEKEIAIENYEKYVQMMKVSGHSDSIPARVLDRIKV